MGNKCLKPTPTLEFDRRGAGRKSSISTKGRTLSSTQDTNALDGLNAHGVTGHGIGAKDQLNIDYYASGKSFGLETRVVMPKGAIEEVKDDDSDKGNFLNNLDNEDSISFGDDSGKDND